MNVTRHDVNIFTSSTNRSISTDSSKIEGKSLMKIMNNRGPKWEPCGTPELTWK